VGRNTTLTPRIIQQVSEMLEQAHFDSVIQDALGIPSSTFYDWLRRGENEQNTLFSAFSETYRRSKANGIARLHMVVFNDALQNPKTAQWILSRKDHRNYGQKSPLFDWEEKAAREIVENGDT